jgi:uncharacterized protein (DUF4213/DUF364 family)
MTEVIEAADAVVATGMTLSNGSFDVLLDRCLQQKPLPLPPNPARCGVIGPL